MLETIVPIIIPSLSPTATLTELWEAAKAVGPDSILFIEDKPGYFLLGEDARVFIRECDTKDPVPPPAGKQVGIYLSSSAGLRHVNDLLGRGYRVALVKRQYATQAEHDLADLREALRYFFRTEAALVDLLREAKEKTSPSYAQEYKCINALLNVLE